MDVRWYQEEATQGLIDALEKDLYERSPDTWGHLDQRYVADYRKDPSMLGTRAREHAEQLIKQAETKKLSHPIVVAPTGSGKTIMICDFVDKYLTKNPRARILVLSHVKEILQQDFDALTDYFPDVQIGLWSAGLKSRDKSNKIIVAGIQTIYKKALTFRDFEVVIIDECHLVTIRQNGMYRKFLSGLHNAHFVGFTATHFRLGHGYIHEGKDALFNNIAYDISQPETFNRLVKEGYLTKLVTKRTAAKMNTRLLRLRGGDYRVDDMKKRFDRQALTDQIVDEIIQFGEHYKKWLIFAIDIDHAEHVTEALRKRNVDARCVHSKMDGDRDDDVEDFRNGKFRCIVNVDILTTGLDVPDIDLIAMLRPTQSPVIHVQTIGRGLRVADGKSHCLILDFAGNTERLGPINDVTVVKPGRGMGGPAPVKICPQCKTLCHPKLKICESCGHEFQFRNRLAATASDAPVVRETELHPGKRAPAIPITETKQPEEIPETAGQRAAREARQKAREEYEASLRPQWHFVDAIRYDLHDKPGRPTSMKVTYRIGLQTYTEYVCYDHEGFAGRKAHAWVTSRAPDGMPMPKNVHELIKYAPWLKRPVQIFANLNERFPDIKDARFSGDWHEASKAQ